MQFSIFKKPRLAADSGAAGGAQAIRSNMVYNGFGGTERRDVFSSGQNRIGGGTDRRDHK